LHTSKEGKQVYEQTALYAETQKNRRYKIDYIGETLAQYHGRDLALGLRNVDDQELLQHLFTKLAAYDGYRLTLGLQNISPATAQKLEATKTQVLSFRNNPCGSDEKVMASLLNFLKKTPSQMLHFYSLNINQVGQLKGAFNTQPGRDKKIVQFDNISWEEIKSNPDTLQALLQFSGDIHCTKGREKIVIRGGKVRKGNTIRFPADDTRLTQTEWEEKNEKKEAKAIQEVTVAEQEEVIVAVATETAVDLTPYATLLP